MPTRDQEMALQVARELLRGSIGVLEVARALVPLLHRDQTIASKEDSNLFIGIESETDHLPVGRIRRDWHPEILSEKDKEMARCEDLWRDQVRAACERIVLRLQKVQ
jgi:hypothetical protein